MGHVMTNPRKMLRALLALTILTSVPAVSLAQAQQGSVAQAAAPGILNREEAQKILPQTVFYRGQSAPVQGRNSAGVRMPDGKLVLFGLVDNSGYSSSVQQTYQAYLLTEVPLHLGGQTLQPGAYGFGFVAGDKMVILDIGANELMKINTTRDESLKRPNPLQVLASPKSGEYRLYLGRNYAAFTPSAR
jgi:hypothetical protein